MLTIEVFAVGSEVIIDGEIPATIKRVCIEDDAGCVTYECSSWDERAHKTDWLRPHDITPKDPTRKTRISMK